MSSFTACSALVCFYAVVAWGWPVEMRVSQTGWGGLSISEKASDSCSGRKRAWGRDATRVQEKRVTTSSSMSVVSAVARKMRKP